MIHTLYGDGIHDDAPAIQELLDTYVEVRLPAPERFYLISKTLVLRSGVSLVLPRFAEIRLKGGSNCLMLKNATVDDYAERITSRLFSHVNRYSPDFECSDISISGGIWNYNNKEQNPNPLSSGKYEPDGYSGFCFLFYNVRNLRLSSLTFKDPANFAVTLDTVSYFEVDNISFDYNDGNLYQSNMDGIHICGNCHHGHIGKLFGTCYDDIVALNAEEGSRGPISDITVSGIYTEGSYSAVRLLSASHECPVRNVHISDIHGTFYHFGIAFMRHYDTGMRGLFENITIDNVYGGKSSRDVVKFYLVHKYRKYGLIDIDRDVDIFNLSITNVHRREFVDSEVPTIAIQGGTVIRNFTLGNVSSVNLKDDNPMPLIVNDAEVDRLYAYSLSEDGNAVIPDNKGCKNG